MKTTSHPVLPDILFFDLVKFPVIIFSIFIFKEVPLVRRLKPAPCPSSLKNTDAHTWKSWKCVLQYFSKYHGHDIHP